MCEYKYRRSLRDSSWRRTVSSAAIPAAVEINAVDSKACEQRH